MAHIIKTKTQYCPITMNHPTNIQIHWQSYETHYMRLNFQLYQMGVLDFCLTKLLYSQNVNLQRGMDFSASPAVGHPTLIIAFLNEQESPDWSGKIRGPLPHSTKGMLYFCSNIDRYKPATQWTQTLKIFIGYTSTRFDYCGLTHGNAHYAMSKTTVAETRYICFTGCSVFM